MENSNNQMQNNNHSLPHRPEYIPGRIQDDRYVRIFDTTLRDGEQAPGAAMSVPHKLDIARTLAKLKVDIIEAGFPASSKDSFEATKLIAKEVGNEVDENGYVPVIAACGRCSKADMDTAWEAVRHAKRPRVTTFIATSEIHMKYKLKKSRAEVLKLAKDTVTYTKSLGCKDIGFAAEDAGRSDKDFLFQVYGEVIEAGATTIHLTDTVGYNFPNEIHQFILDMKDNIRVENAVISIHCHDDLGLANANALAAVQAGARQVDVTINGLGERAGNTALEEFVMAVKCRGKDLMGGIYSGIDTKHILSISKMVEEYTGMSVQANKAIVGANAFAHASGIHQDGVLKHRSTYEIISPEDIGLSRSIGGGIVLGKLSGRNALKSRIVELGYDVDEKVLDKIFQEFKVIAEDKKCVTEEEVKSLLQKALPNFKMAN